MDSKTFIAKLPRIYWSERHPKTYTIFHDGRIRGIGLVVEQDFGAWNLIYDKYDWNTWAGHDYGVIRWSLTHIALKHEHDGVALTDTVIALGPKQWAIWWKTNQNKIPPQISQRINQIMRQPRLSIYG
jgi:hypothetical protein